MAAMLISAQAVDYDGAVLSGAKLNVYDAGTTTPRAIYASKELASGASSANPAVATATGGIAVWVDDSAGDIKITLTNSAGTTTYYSQDNIDPTNGNVVVFPLGGQDQTLSTTDSVTFASLTLGAVSFAGVVADPGSDRLMFWDDSDTQVEWLSLGTGLTISANTLSLDGDLEDISGLTPADGAVIIGDGTDFTTESGATLRTSLGLAIGSDVLAYDANLQAFVSAFTAPTTDGTAGQFITTDGAGVLSFATPAGGGDTLAAANETIAGNWAFTGSPDFTGISNVSAVRSALGVQNVATVAAMTALPKATLTDGDQCEVKCYFTDGDGGGGLFVWSAASSTTADAGWYIASDEAGTGRWVRADRTVVNVRHFGAQGDGVEDAGEATALTAAYDVWVSLMGSQGDQYPAATQRALVIPPGDYFPNSVLTWSPQGTGATISCFGQLREVQINPQGTRQSYTGLRLAGTADETSATTYGILLDDAVSDECSFVDFAIRDRPTGLRIAATNAGNNNFVNGTIRDCTTYGIHADAGASNNFTNVHSDGNAKNLFIDGGSGSGEFKFVNCRFGNTLAAGDDKSVHIIGTSASPAVESYFTQCTFTASRNDGRSLSISGVTDAGGGLIEITTTTEHKLFDGWDDDLTIAGTTSYNGTFDASTVSLTVTGATTFRIAATYVASETGTLSLPPWDLYIESDETSDITTVNDMFFQGGNINHCYIKSALKVQFIGTRLKQSIFMEGSDAVNKKGVHRVFIVGDARGRAQSTFADVPVAGANAGWVRIGTKDDTGGTTPSNTKFVIETPDTSVALSTNNLPTTQKLELSGSAFSFISGATTLFNVADSGDITTAGFISTTGAGTDNKIDFVSNASGSSPLVRPTGSDTNITLRLDSKGTGAVDCRPGGLRTAIFNYTASAQDYFSFNPGASGTIALLASGASTNITMDLRAQGAGAVALRSGGGTRQVQANNTGVGFYGDAPVARYSTTGTTTGFTAGAGSAVLDDSTFTGNTGSTAYTVGDVVRALKTIGLLTA